MQNQPKAQHSRRAGLGLIERSAAVSARFALRRDSTAQAGRRSAQPKSWRIGSQPAAL